MDASANDAWKACRVLIVDDVEHNRAMLGMTLQRAGLKDVAYAVDGQDGLAMIRQFRPDVVLLDVQMPTMDGLEMCRRLRDDPATAELPVIFQTALSGDDERVACFDAGGTDMVSKPINRREVFARIRNHLEKRLLIRELDAYRRRVAQELAQARALQIGLSPSRREIDAIEARLGLSISAAFDPSSEVGGDLWTIFDLGERRLGLFVADLTGHGVGAAMHAFRLHTLAHGSDAALKDDPAAFLSHMNRQLCALLPRGQFATARYAVLDLDAWTLRFASAGVPGPFLGDASGAQQLDTRGKFLSVSPRSAYETQEVALPDQGHLFIYSDALSDAESPEGGRVGESGVDAWRADALAEPRSERLAHVMRAVEEGGLRIVDDLTAIWIDWS